MAVATPILEKKYEETLEEVRYDYATQQAADEIHNSKINEIYARLINPETKMSDMRPQVEVRNAPVQAEEKACNEVYLVNNARADADIFRADSAINRRVVMPEETTGVAAQAVESDEENEDLRPTRTTMQYTTSLRKKDEEGTIANTGAEKRISFTKRDKIIIAVVVTVIVALITLIIVNSAIISGVNSNLGALQSSLSSARAAYNSVSGQIADYESNFDETLKSFAESLGMIK